MASGLRVRRLNPDEKIEFSCDNADLTDFFNNDWADYKRNLLAVTYAIESDGQIVAMFSLSNDRLDVKDFESRRALKRAAGTLPEVKRGFRTFPAVKIVRLAVRTGFTNRGLGGTIISFIQAFLLLKNKTGCLYLTVDAYPQAVGFYQRMGFIKVERTKTESKEMENPDHFLMYLSMIQASKSESLKEMLPIVECLLRNEAADLNSGESTKEQVLA